MPTYRIVVDREPPRHQSTIWIEREDDHDALTAATEMLGPSLVAQVWEDERFLGYVESPPKHQPLTAAQDRPPRKRPFRTASQSSV